MRSNVGAALKACAGGVTLAAALIVAQEADRVEFPTSGSPEAQPHFLRGVAALHAFAYEDAVDAFRRARQIDPRFALACWGEALAHHSLLASVSDVERGRAVLRQLGATRDARLARAGTEKERGLLEAADALFGDGDHAARQRAYVAAMQRLHARYADDNEVASFYALALLDNAIRATHGPSSASTEGHRPAQHTGGETRQRAGTILRQVLLRSPRHPGAAHYLLHAYDDAEHAAQALDTARVYAKIAPESSHARHIPAHIFVRLGLWRDAAASDEAASNAAEASRTTRGIDEARADYHPLIWLQYERLQLGQFGRAREMAERMQAAAERTGSDVLKNHAASMRARYVVEAGRWALLRDADEFGNIDELAAIGISAARAGNVERAEQVGELLGDAASKDVPPEMAPAVTIMEREVSALVLLARGQPTDAIDALRGAVEAERQLPTGAGPPRPIKPADELLGEVLLQTGRAAEAQEAFERALQRTPGRSASVLGLARAVTATGDYVAAGRHYATLLENWSQADADRPELAEARAGLSAANSRGLFNWLPEKHVTVPVLFALATAAIVVLSLRRRPLLRRVGGRHAGSHGMRSRKRAGSDRAERL